MILLSFYCLFFVTGCCSSRYSYYIYKSKGESALKAKNYKKAKNFYSIIYKNESSAKTLDKSRICWAFYRLGVIAELTNDMERAKGYYWGDSIDEGFYDSERLVSWYAKAGWIQIDEKETPRSLEEILEFEKTEPREGNSELPVEIKKEIIVQKKEYKFVSQANSENGEITATYNRSQTLPPADAPAPFKVYR